MKKALAYFWLAFYTMLSMGVEVNLHFCSDQLKTVGLWKLEDCCHQKAAVEHCHAHTACCHAQEAPTKACCSDETVEISIEEEHLSSRTAFEDTSNFALVLSVHSAADFVCSFFDRETYANPKTGPPLEADDSDRYALFQQRLTYG